MLAAEISLIYLRQSTREGLQPCAVPGPVRIKGVLNEPQSSKLKWAIKQRFYCYSFSPSGTAAAGTSTLLRDFWITREPLKLRPLIRYWKKGIFTAHLMNLWRQLGLQTGEEKKNEKAK